MYLKKQFGKILILLSIVTSNLFAIDWKYKLNDSLFEKEIAGQKQYFINFKVYDYFIDTIALYASQYPPKFNNENERKEVIFKTKKLIEYLEFVSKTLEKKEPKIIYRLALANTLGHNLNIYNSGQKAKKYYEDILTYYPNSAQIYFLYGRFLAHTVIYQKESIPILKKAIDLGEKEALFTLGMVYIVQKKNKEALQLLELYSKNYPNDSKVKVIINAIENNNIEINYYK
ncbi:hypothetical protein CRU99_13255 [Malaciobacter mytili]|uniref:tetratricopeptide repeat protein n=1 Tax=Malaciobacter mytili TaxID=603050 RepID=UPI00100C28DE|nr:tetratricopeptide repeat protein [Malaciobacter mytili]RXI36664.1 hypothetical protein CRU99_13255 [Malaciobacter mytili]